MPSVNRVKAALTLSGQLRLRAYVAFGSVNPLACTSQCQGRRKIRPPWRRKTRPSGGGSEFLNAASRGELQEVGSAAC